MAEYRFYDGVPHVSTAEFHQHRERAPHWEQAVHQPRLLRALSFIKDAIEMVRGEEELDHVNVVDLGCGDGGLVAQVDALDQRVHAYGYDFQRSNAEGWVERGVLTNCQQLNFVEDWADVRYGDVYVMTEVLEHLHDPHNAVARCRERGALLVASSPHTEHPGSHDECHAWAWDIQGYAELMRNADYQVARHETIGMFQVVLAMPGVD